MPGVKIVTDSACDLPANLVRELDITVVPLTIRFGEEEFVDGRDLTPAEFWDRCAKSAVLPETAAPAPGAFDQAFRAAAEAGADGVLCINLSGKLSATGQSAATAAQGLFDVIPVRLVDSRSITLGLGLIVLEAARMAAEGADLDTVTAAAEDLVGRTHVLGTIDTLENLKKGGRIGAAQALMGSLLSIKPLIEVRDGAVEPGPKQRTRGRALRYVADKVAAEPAVERLAVMHGAAPDLDQLLDLLAPHFPRDKIVVGDIGPVIGTHSGPRSIGVAYQVK
jgi:DegV family protein with EDD domain